MVDSDVTGPFTKAPRKWLNGYSSNIILEPSIITSLGRDFPGGSRNRVSNAGNRVRKDIQTDEDLAVIDTWRESHRHVINSFQALLRNRTLNTDIFVAQRHKRKRTIFDKLKRYPNMQLGRMDDVAGCRLIFKSVDKLRSFRREIHAARFKHRLKNTPSKYDYIANPKNDGYRGIHDVYAYDVQSEGGRSLKVDRSCCESVGNPYHK